MTAAGLPKVASSHSYVTQSGRLLHPSEKVVSDPAKDTFSMNNAATLLGKRHLRRPLAARSSSKQRGNLNPDDKAVLVEKMSENVVSFGRTEVFEVDERKEFQIYGQGSTSGRLLECDCCGIRFDRSFLQRNSDFVWLCSYCEKLNEHLTSTSIGQMKVSDDFSSAEGPSFFTCKRCSKEFISEQYLRDHFAKQHSSNAHANQERGHSD